MSAKEVRDVPASVRARLLNRARAQHRPFNEVLQYYAMERFLYRFANSSHSNSFLLKGALMLRALGAEMSRPTMDIDLLGRVPNDHESLRDVIRDCISINVRDGMSFDPERVEIQNIVEGADYHGVRIIFDAHLGTARVHMQIDIGFGDKVTPRPMWVDYPEILDFGAPRLRACPPETAVAEKLQIMVDLDAANSRMKDFYDVHLMCCHLDFRGSVLVKAVRATFASRRTEIPAETPLALSPSFCEVAGKTAQWSAFVRKLRVEVPPVFEEVIGAISDFLLPVIQAAANDAHFDKLWSKGGPWRSASLGLAQK